MDEYELTQAIEALVSEYRDTASPVTHAKLREARAELQNLLTKGAIGCSNCGSHPHGIHQPGAYEVGCLTCVWTPDNGRTQARASRGQTIGEAVANWNAEVWYVRPARTV